LPATAQVSSAKISATEYAAGSQMPTLRRVRAAWKLHADSASATRQSTIAVSLDGTVNSRFSPGQNIVKVVSRPEAGRMPNSSSASAATEA
jgi:hypothetical protein